MPWLLLKKKPNKKIKKKKIHKKAKIKLLAEGRSPPQELEVCPRSGLYLFMKIWKLKIF